jgi:DNA-binding MarR family transcriptional regulator
MELTKSVYKIEPEKGLLAGRPEGERVKELVSYELKSLSPGSVLSLSFARAEFVDVSGADEVVVKVLARIEAGEFPDRFLTLSALKPQHLENIKMALDVAKKAVIVDLAPWRWTLTGELNAALRRVLAFIAEKGAATARELVEKLGIEPVNTASTRLVQLYESGLVAREPHREPVRGGGRQFRYYPLVRGQYIEERDGGNWSTEAHRLLE